MKVNLIHVRIINFLNKLNVLSSGITWSQIVTMTYGLSENLTTTEVYCSIYGDD